MELFDPSVRGDLLYFDLDTIIVGPIDDLDTGRLTCLSDFSYNDRMASGVMFLPEHEREEVWKAWIADPEGSMKKERKASLGHGDQGFLSEFWKFKADRWQTVLPGRIVSYALHCKEGPPPDASVVCYHGRPRPRDTNWAISRSVPRSSAP